jgi:ArsR family transcriptional regulator
MTLSDIYQCLSHPTRQRIVHLLQSGELCVCHFQEILGESQVGVSKQLAYLRLHGMVEARKEANWVIYSLPAKPSPELAANLACLRESVKDKALFQRDLDKRLKAESRFADESPICCAPKKSNSPAKELVTL